MLLFGGLYSILQASRAMMDMAQHLGIPAENRICTGNIVADCVSPVETLNLWGNECVPVAGNCENQLGADETDCGCGFARGSPFYLLSKDWYAFASAALSVGDLAYLASAPDLVPFRHTGKQ